MNYKMIDLLDKVIDQDLENDKQILDKEGVMTSENQIAINKLNLMTGAYASVLMDAIVEADMNPQEAVDYIENLYKQNQYMGIYYFLLYLFAALEMDVPYLFMQLPCHTQALQYYIHELIADMKDCCMDEKDQCFCHFISSRNVGIKCPRSEVYIYHFLQVPLKRKCCCVF